MPATTSVGKCTPRYILETPTIEDKNIATTPIAGKNIAVVIAIVKAAVVCPEGKEKSSIPIFLILRLFNIRKGRILFTDRLIICEIDPVIIRDRESLIP